MWAQYCGLFKDSPKDVTNLLDITLADRRAAYGIEVGIGSDCISCICPSCDHRDPAENTGCPLGFPCQMCTSYKQHGSQFISACKAYI